jgi:hypothetical protein
MRAVAPPRCGMAAGPASIGLIQESLAARAVR